MDNSFAVAVYESLKGMRVDSARVTGVSDAFEEGSICDRAYEEMLQAYGAVCRRLGSSEEDRDVERIIHAMLVIERELCIRMFRYGMLLREER